MSHHGLVATLKFAILPKRDVYFAALLDHLGSIRIAHGRRAGHDQLWLQVDIHGLDGNVAQWIRNVYQLAGSHKWPGSLSGRRWQLSAHDALLILQTTHNHLQSCSPQAILGIEFQQRLDGFRAERLSKADRAARLPAEMEYRRRIMSQIALMNRAAHSPKPEHAVDRRGDRP